MTDQPQLHRLRDVIEGQEPVFEWLDRARAKGKLGHAFLFLGPPGTGKTRTAFAFAQELLAGEDAASARRVARNQHPDLHVLLPLLKDEEKDPQKSHALFADYAENLQDPLGVAPNANIGIDQVRRVREEVSKSTVEAAHKVIVIHKAGRLTEPAAQSSLKLIEEPPDHTHLILCAQTANQLLPTIVSRCQRVPIRPLSRQTIETRLEESGVPTAEAALLAALSHGSICRAFQMRDEDMVEVRDTAVELLVVDGATPAAIAQRVDSVSRTWNLERARRSVLLLLTWYHDVLAMRSGIRGGRVHGDRLPEIETLAKRLTPREIERRLQILEEMLAEIEQFVNPVLALESALTRLARGLEPAFDVVS